MLGRSLVFKAFGFSMFSLALWSAAASLAAAQSEPVTQDASGTNATTQSEFDTEIKIPPTRIYGGVWLGFAGHSKVADDTYKSNGASTVGGQFGIDVVGFYNMLSLGAEMRFGSAKSRAGERSGLIDLALKPRLRLVAEENCPLELYLTTPIGITIPRISDSSASSNANLGWNLGLGGGVNLFFTEAFGVNVEPMWMIHQFKVDGNQGGKLTIQEFSLFINAVIAI